MKRKVLGLEVARVTRSAAARGDVADLESARKGWVGVSALLAFLPIYFPLSPFNPSELHPTHALPPRREVEVCRRRVGEEHKVTYLQGVKSLDLLHRGRQGI